MRWGRGPSRPSSSQFLGRGPRRRSPTVGGPTAGTASSGWPSTRPTAGCGWSAGPTTGCRISGRGCGWTARWWGTGSTPAQTRPTGGATAPSPCRPGRPAGRPRSRSGWSSCPRASTGTSSATAICTTGSVETVTDTLDVADPSSEAGHGYEIGTPTWTGTQTFTYPSQIADTGRAHTGSSQFTLSVDPGHTAVLLARRMDHGIADQRATVSVDGVPAGTWEDRGADGLHRWRDSSLALPPALTAGKSRV